MINCLYFLMVRTLAVRAEWVGKVFNLGVYINLIKSLVKCKIDSDDELMTGNPFYVWWAVAAGYLDSHGVEFSGEVPGRIDYSLFSSVRGVSQGDRLGKAFFDLLNPFEFYESEFEYNYLRLERPDSRVFNIKSLDIPVMPDVYLGMLERHLIPDDMVSLNPDELMVLDEVACNSVKYINQVIDFLIL